jgi:uncharacterized protein YllA (UPF0747 family)
MEKAISIDPTLEKSGKSALQKSLNLMGALEQKMYRAIRRKEQLNIDRIDRLFSYVKPSGIPQERMENFAIYYALWGPVFFDALLDEFEVFTAHFHVLEA